MNTAIIGAGSNIDPAGNLDKAQELLQRDLKITACSARLTTKPVGYKDQPDFVNAAFLVETDLGRKELKECLTAIEDRLGRVRTENRFGPRTIDLDILVFNGDIIDGDVFERDFLRTLVAELCPELKRRMSR